MTIFTTVLSTSSTGEVTLVSDDGRHFQIGADQLGELQANDLSAGQRVRIKLRADKIVKLSTVQQPPKNITPAETDDAEPRDAQPSPHKEVDQYVWRDGVISNLSEYRSAVALSDGSTRGFDTSAFRRLQLRIDDVVHVGIDGTGDIGEMHVVKRRIDGRGAEKPDADELEHQLADAESERICSLIRELHRTGHLDWYWREPSSAERSVDARLHLPATLTDALSHSNRPFTKLFSHQLAAYQTLKQGKNVMLTTPTASGKTNCYNPRIVECLLGDPAASALYVFPLNALLNDQVDTLNKITSRLQQNGLEKVRIVELLGKLGPQAYDELLAGQQRIIATNPEMLVFLLGQVHRRSEIRDFFANLRFAVLDEAHIYRGVFGLHMAGIMRRLRLMCEQTGNGDPGPQFVLSSATVAEERKLAVSITDLPESTWKFIGKEDSGRSRPTRHWLMMGASTTNGGPHGCLQHAAEALVTAMLQETSKPIKAILFVRSYREIRTANKLVANLLRDRNREDLIKMIDVYAGGLMSTDDKRDTYARFRDEKNSPRGLIATNALEAGIDLGDLDVCVLAGFPMHIMRMRQMAGRAGRQEEGLIVFIPDGMRSIDQFFIEQPQRLLSQPEESFVLDTDNPYVMKRHLVAAAAEHGVGLSRAQLSRFGRNADDIVNLALQEGRLYRQGSDRFGAKKKADPAWEVSNIRGTVQDTWLLCKAPVGECKCSSAGCGKQKCDNAVQCLDFSYVYRETHPGAVFESVVGDFYRGKSLDAASKVAYLQPMREESAERTFPVEESTVHFDEPLKQRTLENGARLVCSRATVTRTFTGYGEYTLLPMRTCRKCGMEYSETVEFCPTCAVKPRPTFQQSKVEFTDFPATGFSMTLQTIACRLELPARYDDLLHGVAPCPIREPDGPLEQFVKVTPEFTDIADLSHVTGVSGPAAETVFEYFQHWAEASRRWTPTSGRVALFPGVYGQCLCSLLRKNPKLNENDVLTAFGQITGYAIHGDQKHSCRKCFSGSLLLAAHTLEHVVANSYPSIALGDQQDLQSITIESHPQTGVTTIVWYDTCPGGIGASEKVFDLFEQFLHRTRTAQDCGCRTDEGCPRCIQRHNCDRRNNSLSKVSAISLAGHLLGNPVEPPLEPIALRKSRFDKKNQPGKA